MALNTVKVSDEFSKEDVETGLELLKQKKAQKIRDTERRNDPITKERMALAGKRRRVKDKLLLQKAAQANLVVSEGEIDKSIAGS